MAESRAAFVGGLMHGKMWFVPELASVINVPSAPPSPNSASRIVRYIKQESFEFTSLVDDVPSGLYFIEQLDGRSVESLRLDCLWPEGWDYAATED